MSAVNTSPAVGVVALLRREAQDRMANNFPRQADELHAAADAIAELIAADVELDDAHKAYEFETTGVHRDRAWARIQAAQTRRSASLAAIRSGGGLV